MRHCYRLLDDRGVLAMNIVASPTGPGSRFLWAEVRTLEAVFPQVEVFAVYDSGRPDEIQNMAVIASKSSSVDLLERLAKISPDLTARRVEAPGRRPACPSSRTTSRPSTST